MAHWSDPINPCEYQAYWKLISWVETGCECCAATRMFVVAFPLGVLLGMFLPDVGWIMGIFALWVIGSPWILMAARKLYGGPDGMVRDD